MAAVQVHSGCTCISVVPALDAGRWTSVVMTGTNVLVLDVLDACLEAVQRS